MRLAVGKSMSHDISDGLGRVTKAEHHARKSMISCIRLAYISGPPYDEDARHKAIDEFVEHTQTTSSLSDLYALLNKRKRASLREIVENPAVRYYGHDGKEWWIDAMLDLLARLESGNYVGDWDEKQISLGS